MIGVNETDVSDDSDISLDPEDFADEYVSLKTRMYQLNPRFFDQGSGGGGRKARLKAVGDIPDPRVQKIQRKIAKIESDILFDSEIAENRWREKFSDLWRESAFVREKERAVAVTKNQSRGDSQPTISEDTGDFVMVEAAESGDEALLGGIFTEDLDEAPPLVQDAPSSAINVIDFGVSTGGVDPEKLLKEVCTAR